MLFGDIMNVTRIALTGAPCSGKTTVINYLKMHYERKNYFVVVMPECAREVIKSGFPRDDMYAFEKAVIERQIQREEQIELHLKNENCENAIVLYDRGIADAFSYLNKAQSDKMKKHFNTDFIKIWSRYDAAVMLELPSNSYYLKDCERYESYEQALINQDRLLDAWVGHPHFRVVGSCDDIEEKAKGVIAEIDCILSNIEHEIKYLIEYPDINELRKYKIFKTDIEQIYLLSDTGSHRIRKRGAGSSFCCFENVKIRISGDKCHEYESVISYEKYNELKALADPKKHPIVKNRYCLLYENQYFELDVFPFWSDRALLELELSRDGQTINLPPEINVIKDVSKSKKYKNNYLASVNFNEDC